MEDVREMVAPPTSPWTDNLTWLTQHNATLAEWNAVDMEVYEFGKVGLSVVGWVCSEIYGITGGQSGAVHGMEAYGQWVSGTTRLPQQRPAVAKGSQHNCQTPQLQSLRGLDR